MPEYGGMRVDPERYPLIYNRIVYAARTRFGPGSCVADCTAETPIALLVLWQGLTGLCLRLGIVDNYIADSRNVFLFI